MRAWEASTGNPGADRVPAWIQDLSSTVDLGPQAEQLPTLIGSLSSEDGRSRLRSQSKPDLLRDRNARVVSLHEATWAVQLSGRTTAAAIAQFLTAQAYIAGGFTLRDTCQGAWSILSGEVQVLTVADLLPSTAMTVLEAPPRRDRDRRAARWRAQASSP